MFNILTFFCSYLNLEQIINRFPNVNVMRSLHYKRMSITLFMFCIKGITVKKERCEPFYLLQLDIISVVKKKKTSLNNESFTHIDKILFWKITHYFQF